MSEWQVAALLTAVVITVIVATRPAPPRRRRTRSSRPAGAKTESRSGRHVAWLDPRSSERTDQNAIHRNLWDRADIAAGVGRDDVVADPTLVLWPTFR